MGDTIVMEAILVGSYNSRLVETKRTHDPNVLFFVNNGVGSEQRSC